MPKRYIRRPDGTLVGYNGGSGGDISREEFDKLSDAIADLPTTGGMSGTARNLLITILRNGVYSTDQSANITALATALESGSDSDGGEDEPNEPETTTYTITNNLTEASNSSTATTAKRNTAYTATLTAADGYVLDSVTVTMGGTDITDSVYADGAISIPAVTGNVVITATAVVGENTSGYVNLFDKNTMVIDGGFAFQTGYIYRNANSKYAVVPVVAGKQYSIQGWDVYSTTKFGSIVFSSDDDFSEDDKEYYAKPLSGIHNFSAYDSSNAVTDAFTVSADTNNIGVTFTVPSGCTRIAVSVCIQGGTNYADTIMVEEGNTCHDYVPYAE